MIDCPICHVRNEDDARFCAECGQRLNGPGQPAEQQAPQQQPTHPQPPRATGGRLNSPLLSSSGTDSFAGQPPALMGAPEPQVDSAGEVSRLRQMAAKQQDKPLPPQLDTPFKNPFDPRNDPRNQPQASPAAQQPGHPPVQQSAPPAPPKGRLRSPLLAGDEFDEENEYEEPARYEQAQGKTAGKPLRSPLLGGGGGGGGASAKGYAEDDYESADAGGGGHLRSPLLGGGGGYSGTDRRRAANEQPYGGQERRQSHLRSPILQGGGGGGGEFYDDYEQADEYEELDEDNPNVLRSPLLAAKRPLERPSGRAPQGSNVQRQSAASPPVELQQGQGQPPNSSYNNLQSIRTAASPAAAQAVPPLPAAPPPLTPSAPAGQGQIGEPSPSLSEPASGSYMTGAPGTLPVQSAPAATSPTPSAWPQSNAPRASTPDLQAPWPATSGTSGLNAVPTHVQPPATSSSRPQTATPGEAPAPGSDTAFGAGSGSGRSRQPADSQDNPSQPEKPARGKPRMLGGAADSDYDDHQYNEHAGGRFNAPAEPASPMPKIVGGVAVLLLLVQLGAFAGFMGDPQGWGRVGWMMMDHIVVVGTLICIIVLAFTSKR